MNKYIPSVSIIVAVYNASLTIRRAIDSIINQTFRNIEIILINDGSTDNSGEICDQYALIDNRIRVIHQTNQGVSKVRQLGINESTGKYTIHVDPDDWIELNMIERLFNVAEEENSDIVICDYFSTNGYNEYYISQKPNICDKEEILCELFYKLTGSLCNKLIKKDLYINNRIEFQYDISCGEDYITCLRLVKHSDKIAYLQEAFYHYDHTSNPKSLTKTRTYDTFIHDEEIVLNIYKTDILDNGYDKIFNSQVVAFAWTALSNNILPPKIYYRHYKKSRWALLYNKSPLYQKMLTFIAASGLYRFSRLILSLGKNIRLIKNRFVG